MRREEEEEKEGEHKMRETMRMLLTRGLETFNNSSETSKMRWTTSLGELKEKEEK